MTVRMGDDGAMHCERCNEIVILGEKHQCKDAVWRASLGIEKTAATTNVDEVLDERGKRYGKFEDHARIAQDLKLVIREYGGFEKTQPDQREALEMICHKIARIINGDPNYADSWVDIAGYAKLVADRLEGKAR